MKKLINKILSFFKKKEVVVEAPKKAVKTKKAKV
jgi:hypothetical protein